MKRKEKKRKEKKKKQFVLLLLSCFNFINDHATHLLFFVFFALYNFCICSV